MKNFFILNKNVSSLNTYERFHLIYQLTINKSAFKYVKKKLKKLSIKIGSNPDENIIQLMKKGALEGWCWQTTESSIIFFNDDDYIERGNLKFDTNQNIGTLGFVLNSKAVFGYLIHVFKYSLQNIYYRIFEITEIAGVVTAKSVKEDLIYRMHHPKKQPELNSTVLDFLAQLIPESTKNETLISGNNDVKSPMYRNNVGYTATIDNNGKINNLIAHYYFNG